jgi:hypothetical protein
VHPALEHCQKDNPYEAAMYPNQACSSSAAPPGGPPSKISLPMKNSLTWTTSSDWTLANAPGFSSHRQEHAACSRHPAPEPLTHQK